MTPAQRRQHYDAWRVSGMSRTAYARQHGINNKTFWHLCRAFSADDARGPAPADIWCIQERLLQLGTA
ncbi:hypothetical protein ACM7WX_004376 [Escherichia coli]